MESIVSKPESFNVKKFVCMTSQKKCRKKADRPMITSGTSRSRQRLKKEFPVEELIDFVKPESYLIPRLVFCGTVYHEGSYSMARKMISC